MHEKKQFNWQWYLFRELSAWQLYSLLKLRQDVFVVEQNCAYLDCDNNDQTAHHLICWSSADTKQPPVGYLRLLPPKNDDDKVRLGRLATAKDFRGQHIASTLLHEALRYSEELYPHQQVKISAQLYLEKFYQSFGFVSTTEPYDEDGIPHIAMIRSARISPK